MSDYQNIEREFSMSMFATQSDRNEAMVDEIFKLRAEVSRLTAELADAKSQLETERLRLAGCGVAALGYFDGCKDEYRSASLDDVLRLRANCDQYRNELAELRSQEPVARLLLGIGSDLYLKGRTIARTYDELAENRYPEAWQEGEKLYARPVPAAQAVPEGSCLCCGQQGTPKTWMIGNPKVYVCERCHRRATVAVDYKANTEEEGDAYTHGFFDGHDEALLKQGEAK